MFGHGREGKRAGRRQDARLIDIEPVESRGFRPGGDQDTTACQGPGRSAARRRIDVDAAGAGNMRAAGDAIDPVLPEQERDPLGQVLDHLVLAGEHPGKVEGKAVYRDPVIRQAVARLDEAFRRFEQRLGGDAADIEAGSAPARALVDAGDGEAELGRPDRRGIAARPGTDDDQVVTLVCHGSRFRLRAGCAPDPRCTP